MRAESPSRLTARRRAVLDRLLDHFLDLEDAERAASLARFGQRYPRLHLWLAKLLEASYTPTEQIGAAVSRTAQRAVAARETVSALPAGTLLGAWRIIGQAGRGGMGVVYQAERADGAFEMTAAIKLIASRRPGMAERLVQERQLLARLDHAGISRLIDGGLTEDGCAYLVMEWVAGEDLSEKVRGRLDPFRTFGEIAEALTHAHQRMVVHGDIKPGNVRITPDGRARLLDFGVARLLADEVSEEPGDLRALTPAFAAPELLAGQPATAQSDVWAMGALLNWLLTGRCPPGDGAAPNTAGMRHGRAADLAAVIARACAADPAARYPSVAALADEVRRVREHHPVQVRPGGPLRRLRLWSQRNPVGAVLALVLTVGAVTGAALLGWQAQVVRAERDLARFENTRWEIMRDQLVTLFQAVSEESASGELGARELLDGSVDRLEEVLGDDELGQAHIKSMLGALYVSLQDYQNAAAILRRFVETDDGRTAPMLRSQAYGNLARAEVRLGNHAEGQALVERAIDMMQALPGDHRRRLAELHQVRALALTGLGQWTQAIAALEEGLRLAEAQSGGPSRSRAQARNNLGATLVQAGRLDEAQRHLDASLDDWRAIGLGESNDALNVINNLATVYHRQGRLAEAKPLYAEAIALRRQRFGESAALAATMNNYGLILVIRYRLDEARTQFEEARDLMARFAGEASPNYAITVRSLGLLELTGGDLAAAERQLARAEAIMLDSVGPDHLFTAIVRTQSAVALAPRDAAAAVAALGEVSAQLRSMGPPAETHLATALCEKSVVLLELDRPGFALEAADDCLAIRRRQLPAGNWETTKAEALVAMARHRQGQADVRPELAEAVRALATTYGPGHPRLAWLESQAGAF